MKGYQKGEVVIVRPLDGTAHRKLGVIHNVPRKRTAEEGPVYEVKLADNSIVKCTEEQLVRPKTKKPI